MSDVHREDERKQLERDLKEDLELKDEDANKVVGGATKKPPPKKPPKPNPPL